MTIPMNLRFGGVNLTSGSSGDGGEMPPETPFRLLVCGNFSGTKPNAKPLAQRKPIEIDRDNFDDVLAKFAPSVTLPSETGGDDLKIAFRELDDFEPDKLFPRLEIFDELRALQAEVSKPATFERAAAKIRGWANIPDPAIESSAPPTSTPKAAASAEDILQQVLEAKREESGSELPGASDWQQFLKSIVKPQLVEKTDPRKADYEAVVEESIGVKMCSILHHPRFQALEAAWRSVYFLIKRLPTDETLKVFILDATLDEWRADLKQDDPSDTVFVREVNDRVVDSPWAAFVSLETFGNSVADLELLAAMAVLASRSRTPVLAAASPALVGCRSLATDPDPRKWQPDAAISAAWSLVRGLDAARSLGLVIPRFLLRLPYGEKGTRTDSLRFEELPRGDHEHYLWGSGAVAAALLLAQGFIASGWSLNPDDIRAIDGLPVHVFDDDGEAATKPCAEVNLREAAAETFVENGLMTLASVNERDAIRLLRFQSAAAGNERLAGWWE